MFCSNKYLFPGRAAGNALSKITYLEYTKTRWISRNGRRVYRVLPHADTHHCALRHGNAADIMCADGKSSGRTANRDETADGTTKTLLTAVHGLRWEARQCGQNTIILQLAARQYNCISNEFRTPFNSRTKKTFYSQTLKHFNKTADKWRGALHCLRQYQGRSVGGDQDDDRMTFGCCSWRWYWQQFRFELELPHELLNNFEHKFQFK
jgi:hypothetical protein